MDIKHLSKVYNVVCTSEKTRHGFRHIAVLHKNGFEVCRAKCCYLNRTWERYQFQSVIHDVIRKHFGEGTREAKRYCKAADDNYEKHDRQNSPLHTASAVAALGAILCTTPEEKNAFKKRILSTVPGIDIPEDFDKLPEAEKARRLDGVIDIGLDKK